jgi:asparagine N-glycosylation enzyme membrane subunit Stt3
MQPATGREITISATDLTCFGGNTATAAAIGTEDSSTYSWGTMQARTRPTAKSLTAGKYNVSITDGNNCSKIEQIIISEPNEMVISGSQTNFDCFGNEDGSAKVLVYGGKPHYSYSWNTIPEQNSNNATGLKAGTYLVTISDENNCTLSKPFTITQPSSDIITSVSVQTNVDCFGNNTGAATIIASGGNGSLSYSWNTIPVKTTATATGLIEGTYKVKITDANGCSTIQTIIMT